MNNSKKIIQIVVIVIAFGASGYLLYHSFFAGKSPQAILTAANPEAAATSNENLLPEGKTFDLDSYFKNSQLRYGLVSNPSLNPSQDVGVAPQNLFGPSGPSGTTGNQ